MADQALEAFLDAGAPAEAAQAQATDATPAAQQTDVAKDAKADAAGATSAQQAGSDQDPDIGPVPYKRFKTVLDKQHALERELSEIRGYVSAQSRQQQPRAQQSDEERQKAEEDAVYSDLPGAMRKMREEIRREVTANGRRDYFELSESAMRSSKADYDEKRQAFEQALAAQAQAGDDSLQRNFMRSRDPARFIYETGAMVLETKDIGSPAEYRAKVAKEVRAEVEAEVRKKLAIDGAAQASTTNAGARIASASPVAAREYADKDLFRGVGA